MQKVSELREPPVMGQYYQVPVVENYPWYGRRATWPVLGPLLEDNEFFEFPRAHYHIDVRFVSRWQFRLMADKVPWPYRSGDDARDAALSASGSPLITKNVPLPTGRPVLRRLRCKRPASPTNLLLLAGNDEIREAMSERYGDPAPAICLRDGRKLCPHRKADLSSFPPDESGVVVCPLHGLRVRVAEMPA